MMKNKQYIAVCPFLRREVDAALKLEGFNGVETFAFPPKCNRKPLIWDDIVQSLPKDVDSSKILVLGSYCVSGLKKIPKNLDGCNIIHLNQCNSILVNQEILESYQKKGKYLLTPGWVVGWQQRLKEWGFDYERDQKIAREFFKESNSGLMLIDTGISDKSTAKLKEFAEYIDLPYDFTNVGLDYLRLFLSKIILTSRLEKEKEIASTAVTESNKEMADYAMAMEVFDNMSKMLNEKAIIEQIMDLFYMLFAPKSIYYLAVNKGDIRNVNSRYSLLTGDETVQNRLKKYDGEYGWTENGNGFRLTIGNSKEKMGVIEVNDIAFPEHKEQYLTFALSLIVVCGLAIDNTRKYQKITEQKNQISDTLEELKSINDELEERVADRTELLESANTKLELALSKEKEYNELQTRFINMISHEYRTPLTVILSSAGLIKISMANNDFTRLDSHIDKINLSVKMLTNLVGDVLTFGKRKKIQLSPSPINIVDFVSETIEEIKIIDEADHGFIFNYEEEYLAVLIDKNLFRQILWHLLINAMKYSHEKSNIEIHLIDKANEVEIRIKDYGIGISEENIKHLFDPFYKSKEIIGIKSGTGLGLSIVNKFINALNGRVTVESELGKGSTFLIAIPKIEK